MAARDFTANQIRTAKVIMTGSDPGAGGIGHKKLELSIYSESVAPDQLGGTPTPNPYLNVGNDTTIFVSGSQTAFGGSIGGVSMFGGDTYVSGSLIVKGAGRLSHGASISGSIHHTATGDSYLKAGGGISITSGSAEGGQVTITNTCCADPDPVIATIDPQHIIISTDSAGNLTTSSINSAIHFTEANAVIGNTAVVYDGDATAASGSPAAFSGTNNRYKLFYALATPAYAQGITAIAYDFAGGQTNLKAQFIETGSTGLGTIVLRNASTDYGVLCFTLTESGETVKFTVNPTNHGSAATRQDVSSGGANWKHIRITVPFKITDTGGNTQTINRGFVVIKNPKGTQGDPIKGSWDPATNSLFTNHQGTIITSPTQTGASGLVYYSQLFAGNTAQATYLGSTGETGSKISPIYPAAANSFYIDYDNATVEVRTYDGTVHTNITTTYAGAAPSSGAKTLTLQNADASNHTFAVFKWDFHSFNSVNRAKLYINSIDTLISGGSHTTATEWREIVVVTPCKVTTNNGSNVDINLVFKLIKRVDKTSQKIRMQARFNSPTTGTPLIDLQSSSGGIVNSTHPSSTDYVHSNVADNQGNRYEYDGSGNTYVASNSHYNVYWGGLDINDVEVRMLDGTSLNLTGYSLSLTGTNLTLKKDSPSHVLATLAISKDTGPTPDRGKALLTVVNSRVANGASDPLWGAIIIKDVEHYITDVHGNNLVVREDFAIRKVISGRSAISLNFHPNIIRVASDSSGTLFAYDGSSGNALSATVTNNPYAEALLSGADLVSVVAHADPDQNNFANLSNNNYNLDFSQAHVVVYPYGTAAPTVLTASRIVYTDTDPDGSPSLGLLELKGNTDGAGHVTFMKLKLLKDATTGQARLYIANGTLSTFKDVSSGADTHWTRVTISIPALVKDNNGNTATSAKASFDIIKTLSGGTIKVVNGGDSISGATGVQRGDLILRTTDNALYAVTDAMMANKANALTVAVGGAPTAGLGPSTSFFTVETGVVASTARANAGSGYSGVPTVTFSAPVGGGSTATGTAVLSGDVVNSVTVTSGGSGYDMNPPTINITGGGGSNAAYTAVMQEKIVSPSGGNTTNQIDIKEAKDTAALATIATNGGNDYMQITNTGEYFVSAKIRVLASNHDGTSGDNSVSYQLKFQFTDAAGDLPGAWADIPGSEGVSSIRKLGNNTNTIFEIDKTKIRFSNAGATLKRLRLVIVRGDTAGSGSDQTLTIPALSTPIIELTKL